MNLNKVDLSNLNVEDLNLVPFVENGKKLRGRFTEDGKPLIILKPKIKHGGGEEVDDFNYLMVYDYDEQNRVVKVETLYQWFPNYQWYPYEMIKYRYIGVNSNPSQVNLSSGFWVANVYNKDFKLIQSVTSEGATLLQQWDEDGYLMTKKFKIKSGELYHEYKYTFGINEKEFIQYEDSFGNFWDVKTGFPCPFENPVKIYAKGFLDDNHLYKNQ